MKNKMKINFSAKKSYPIELKTTLNCATKFNYFSLANYSFLLDQ